MTKNRTVLLIGTILALIIAFGATVAFAQDPDGADPDPDTDSVPVIPFKGRFGRHGFGGQLEGVTPQNELLAAELGISVEDLQEAHSQVWATIMEQGPGGFRGHRGFGNNDEHAALLAEALSDIVGEVITVEELQAAQEKAHDKWLDQMLEAGYLDEEQISLMEARQALKEYIDRDVLLEETLGMSVEELKEALAAGTPLSELLGDKTFQEMAAEMQAAYAAAVQAAVDDNIITQEQADQILSGAFGLHGFGGHSGFGGLGHPGGFGGNSGFRGFHQFNGGNSPVDMSI